MGGGVVVIIRDSSRMPAGRANATACLGGKGLRLICGAINGSKRSVYAEAVVLATH